MSKAVTFLERAAATLAAYAEVSPPPVSPETVPQSDQPPDSTRVGVRRDLGEPGESRAEGEVAEPPVPDAV
jgi:hypothetical protein